MHERLDLGALGHVGDNTNGLAAQLLNLGNSAVDAGLVGGDVVDADVVAVFCEAEGYGFAAAGMC